MAESDRIASPPAETLWPFPDYRDLYLLVAGVLIGVVLSPAVMGQFVPNWSAQLFGGTDYEQQADDLQSELDKLSKKWQKELQTLADSGVSQAAVQQQRKQYKQQRQAIQQRRQQLFHAAELARDQRAGRMLVAIMLTLGLVMVIEAFVAPQPDQTTTRTAVPKALGRLKTVRYALLAIFAALLLARPSLLVSATFIFTALLAAVALVVGLVPLGRRQQQASE
jgi:hypothetical protein